jgi:hypothetical protein
MYHIVTGDPYLATLQPYGFKQIVGLLNKTAFCSSVQQLGVVLVEKYTCVR